MGGESDTRRLVTEIADASGLPVDPDLDRFLNFTGATQQRMAELPLQADQIDALRHTVDDLTRKLAEATAVERPARAAAIDALASGDSLAAEKLFETEYDVQSTTADDARRRMADAARGVANLALLRDVTKAVLFYRKALEADPEDTETARLFGYALMLVGDLTQAEAAMTRSIEASVVQRDSWGEMAAVVGLGDVLVAQGDGPGGLDAYRKSLGIAEELATRDPANTQWQRDLSVSHERVGDVLVAQGDMPQALDAYRRSLAIRERLAAYDPGAARAQVDVSVSCAKLGTIRHGQDVNVRRQFLIRGRAILLKLKSVEKLLPNQDKIDWFDRQLDAFE
jgi:tetratricopeptide (TPR) repeat protein